MAFKIIAKSSILGISKKLKRASKNSVFKVKIF